MANDKKPNEQSLTLDELEGASGGVFAIPPCAEYAAAR